MTGSRTDFLLDTSLVEQDVEDEDDNNDCNVADD